MAKGPRYKVPFRRRREGVTNYYKRRKLLLSGKPRLVVRKTINHIIAQIVVAKPIGDEVIVSAHSNELRRDYGWLADTNNIPAAYLVGLLLGLKALKKGIKEAIPDVGLHRALPGVRIFSVIRGVIDAGLKVPCDPSMFPQDERIRGEHIANYAKFLESRDPEELSKRFSRYLAKGLDPKELPSHFKKVKSMILARFNMPVLE